MLNLESLPKHLAIIMDGNGRWANNQGRVKIDGYRKGSEVAFDIAKHCTVLAIPYLTLYAFSMENWLRSENETDYLFNLFYYTLTNEDKMKFIYNCNIKLNFIGNLSLLPSKIFDQIKKAEEVTHKNDGLLLTVAVSYGAKQEIIHAINNVIKGNIDCVLEEEFEKFLYTKDLPKLDLLIRTGGEKSEKVNKELPALTVENAVNYNIIVGLLQTDESQNIYEIFNNFGVKTIFIDYDKIINLKEIQEEFAKQDEILAKKLILDRIKVEVAKFIKEQKINRIFISDNFHSALNPYRQLVNEAIVKIVDDNPTIHLLAICGGLQDIMHAKEIEITNVVNDEKNHLKSASYPQKENIPLQQIKIVPGSSLEKVVARFLLPNQNGWFSTYFPNAHSGTVSNTTENRRRLELLGYKIAAFANDGLIEAIEDKHSNIYFQSHLEALVVKSDKNSRLSSQKVRQVSTLVAIAIINDFLHRV
ncbi:jg18328 [Pararge aegeria aegeria]|uniref:ditrans,polycis-polyprenyl diphosphate synthase [(2E,6E)-farnesyldiphosphate specific] n=1 Tax=Pararge aegeria aegeria TaxID=348720 RepID=A0A8S4RH93_9NEOP|nr:jg18328 [Pararge aegeria aegeria]